MNGRDRERLEDSYEQEPADRRVLVDDVPAGCAYAVIDPSNDPCGRTERTIEIRAPSGKLCGALKFPVDGGGYCWYGDLQVGYDGTIVQQLAQGSEKTFPDGTRTCTWRWWPHVLGAR